MASVCTFPNDIEIHVCFTEMKTSKKYKNLKTKEIVSTFCGIFNSYGGRVTIRLEAGTVDDIQTLKRTIEQLLSNILGFSSMRDCINLASSTTEGYVFIVESVSSLCTMNYNLYLPSETQVIAVPPKTLITEVREILSSSKQRIVEVDKLVKIGTHHKEFAFQRPMSCGGLAESKTIQLKCLKSEKSKCVTLSDRMTNKLNKFANYVSAFANHHGGHIYYGVKDDGVVEGELVKDKDKKEITKKVSKAINKMKWPFEEHEATRGNQWDIFFEPVKDNNDDIILSMYVIVIYISRCIGGVFTDEPESYHIVDGAVKTMGFQEWKDKILLNQTSLPLAVERGTFSSATKQKRFYVVMEKMMDLRNGGDNKTFTKYVDFVNDKWSEPMVELATLSQEATVAFRKRLFPLATEIIKKYDDLNSSSGNENMLISEAMGLYIKSAHLRAQGKFQESHELANVGLQMVEGISPGLIQAWFYTHTAMLGNIIAADSKRPETSGRLVVDAKCFFKRALDYSQTVTGFDKALVDLQQKVYIQLSLLYLGSSLSGSVVSIESVSSDDVTSAKNCLMMVNKLITEGHPLSPLRQVQYLMARSTLSLRLSQLRDPANEQEFTTSLRSSMLLCEEALELANINQFDEMIRYCCNQKAVLTEEIIRNADRHVL